MPLAGLICPDGKRVKLGECVNCRIGRRCLTLPTLMAISNDRKWSGVPSTTQLLQPTRIAWLKINKPYYIPPKSRAFMLLGIRHHAKLEYFAKVAGLIAEHKLDGEISGILDLLEEDIEKNKQFILSDYKSWGSYSVVRSQKGDMGDVKLQLNHYRVKVEQSKKLTELIGFPIKISRMQIQTTVRDGGTKSAYRLGIGENIMLIDVPFMDDKSVLNYFNERAKLLKGYLDSNEMPPMCTSHESWGYKRCRAKAWHCEVWESCPEGRKINKLPPLKTEDDHETKNL